MPLCKWLHPRNQYDITWSLNHSGSVYFLKNYKFNLIYLKWVVVVAVRVFNKFKLNYHIKCVSSF